MSKQQHYLDSAEDFLFDVSKGATCTALAHKAGLSASLVRHYVRIARKLSPSTKALCQHNPALSMGHARVLASLSPKDQEEYARRTLAKGWSVRWLEQEVRTPNKAHYDDRYYEQLSEHLSEQLGHPLTVLPSGNKLGSGYMQIQYRNSDDFENICERLGIRSSDD